jgi:hypothetical protein
MNRKQPQPRPRGLKPAPPSPPPPKRKREMTRRKWETLNGFYDDETGALDLYYKDKGCYDCCHVFKPVAIDIARMCGQMLIDGVKDADADVYKDSTCNHFLIWEQN